MLNTAHRMPDASLDRLHPSAIESHHEIRSLLERALAAGVELRSGVNKALERETARIVAVEPDRLRLSIQHLDRSQRNRLILSFPLGRRKYVFSARVIEAGDESLVIALPEQIYLSERRDRPRRRPGRDTQAPHQLALQASPDRSVAAEVLDFSADGAAVRIPSNLELPEKLRVTAVDGPDAGRALHAQVQNREQQEPGWTRIGLSLRAVPAGPLIEVERRGEPSGPSRLLDRWHAAAAGLRASGHRVWRAARRAGHPPVEVIDFQDARGETIRAIVDRAGSGPGAPVILMPPAFAKTKETLLPLARTIVETFAAAGEPVVVVRTDGIRRRGESHNDPGCTGRGAELHHYTYSQGVSDIGAAIAFLRSDPRFQAEKIVLVTFSSASIEARRLVADDETAVAGWISVVGAADLKSGWQVLSGGIDYIGGYEQGVRFGIQKVLGIEGDIDRIAADALQNGLAHMEDARRQMARMRTPVTWFLGRYDAWIDPDRVRELMSCGDTAGRRLVEVPTGHQLRTSAEAFGTFRAVAEEAGRMLAGRALPPALPDFVDLDRRRQAELARLLRPEVDLEGFWRQYMLGEGRHAGMEILLATSAYRELLSRQIDALALRPGDVLADVGSGTGPLLDHLAEARIGEGLQVHELELVPEALERARERFRAAAIDPRALRAEFLQVDLDAGPHPSLPLADRSCDRVLLSLLLNYVADPAGVLREVGRVLRPGGRVVATVLRPDADISRIYADVSTELRSGLGRRKLGLSPSQLDESISQFLNQVGRLLDLEELGVFHTWSPDDLSRLARRAGFDEAETEAVFGDPGQAILVSAVKPKR